MCGIAGFMEFAPRDGGRDRSRERRVLEVMTETVHARGPDGEGFWLDPDRTVALGHRRLAIQDPTEAGAQPMVSACGRFVLTFNGEIYGFKRLRSELEGRGVAFSGGSDSEVLLGAVQTFGFEAALERIEGMYAFALYDRRERVLMLARDRIGKKPLYYGSTPGSFFFGSLLATVAAHPDFEAEIDRDALARFLQIGWVPSPHSIYRSVRKLPPGGALRVRFGEAPPSPWLYWSAAAVARRGETDPFEGDFEQARRAVGEAIENAVAKRLVADVEVGALLSGGVDSSLVVGVAQRLRDDPIRTYSIGFEEAAFDESPYAREIAKHFGTRHRELIVRADDALDLVPDLTAVYDEPMADPSGLPTLLLSRMVSEDVKVALSGDGGDEFFAGYPRHVKLPERWRRLARLPAGLRSAWEGIAHGFDAATARVLLGAPGALAAGAEASRAGRELPKLLRKLSPKLRPIAADDLRDFYLRSHERFRSEEGFVLGATDPVALVGLPDRGREICDPLALVLYLDAMSFLSDDILVKVDRASMSTGLEVRSPLLDTRLLELAWSLPREHRIDERGAGKRVLRALLAEQLPRELVDRPKQGFNMPISEWLNGPLRPMVEDLLSCERLERQGLLDATAVSRVWREHTSGWRGHKNLVWSLVLLQSWLDSFHTRASAPARR